MPQMLVAALGVGIAGGSFAVGVAYVSRFFPAERQGTALGIFGVGNVGAAVTKFLAPFVLVAWGWEAVAQVWAAVLALMAVVFWLTTGDDPVIRARRAGQVQRKSLASELEPLRNLQVWRFALYYFFVFGAFVALALWLPRYLIGVYGFDIRTAGMIGAIYSIPASVFRAYGGVLSDKAGARTVMYWTFAVSAVCTLILSMPAGRPLDLRRRDLRPRLLHEPRQGGGLQAHPGLLPGERRRGRRPRRHDRRPRRLHPAARLRRPQRPHRPLVELLHGALRHRRRRARLDAPRHPPAWRPAHQVRAA